MILQIFKASYIFLHLSSQLRCVTVIFCMTVNHSPCCKILYFAWPLDSSLPASPDGLPLCSPSLCRPDRSAGRSATWVWCGVYARYGLSPAPLSLSLTACILCLAFLFSKVSLTNQSSLLTNKVSLPNTWLHTHILPTFGPRLEFLREETMDERGGFRCLSHPGSVLLASGCLRDMVMNAVYWEFPWVHIKFPL